MQRSDVLPLCVDVRLSMQLEKEMKEGMEKKNVAVMFRVFFFFFSTQNSIELDGRTWRSKCHRSCRIRIPLKNNLGFSPCLLNLSRSDPGDQKRNRSHLFCFAGARIR